MKRGYLDELIATCKHVVLVEILTTFFLFTTQMGEIYSVSYTHLDVYKRQVEEYAVSMHDQFAAFFPTTMVAVSFLLFNLFDLSLIHI